jgi:sugar phosphate isomerase/epimerase
MNESPSLDRLCIHTITTKPLALEEAIDTYAAAGVGGVTVWADAMAQLGPQAAGDRIRGAGMQVVSLCRGGFFVSDDKTRRTEAVKATRAMMEDAALLGAPHVVLVCGADPAVPLDVARDQIRDAIETLLPDAERLGVRLAVEPLHPMYADTRSAVVTLGQANDLVEAIAHESVGVAIDVYHLWWDDALQNEIARCGERIMAFHVSDWKSPTTDLLNDRGLMGEGCIPIRRIRGWVESAGFLGPIEVEIFSDARWAGDQREFVRDIVDAYGAHV